MIIRDGRRTLMNDRLRRAGATCQVREWNPSIVRGRRITYM